MRILNVLLAFVLPYLSLIVLSSLADFFEVIVVLILTPLDVDFELPSGPSDLQKP